MKAFVVQYGHPRESSACIHRRRPAGKRSNTRDNTPAVVHVEMVPGGEVEVAIAAKGGGSKTNRCLKC
jgi:tartrate dehydratase alpha subunit/fumarate hydratase class I-like protein